MNEIFVNNKKEIEPNNSSLYIVLLELQILTSKL